MLDLRAVHKKRFITLQKSPNLHRTFGTRGGDNTFCIGGCQTAIPPKKKKKLVLYVELEIKMIHQTIQAIVFEYDLRDKKKLKDSMMKVRNEN